MGVDFLKLEVPCEATPDTAWRITRVSRQPYWVSTVTVDEQGNRRISGYVKEIDAGTLESDSDIHAVAIDRVVSVSPLTIDLTANDSTVAVGVDVTFRYLATGTSIAEVNIDFDDGGLFEENFPPGLVEAEDLVTHTYVAAGTYVVTAEVVVSTGSVVDSVTVEVN